jgi:transcriptional/translational regulatory protein YebC/TACO1
MLTASCVRGLPSTASVVAARALAGHSHWHNVRHRKARADEARGALFTKLSLAITASAREQLASGKPFENGEFGLRLARAVDEARKYSLPRARIDAAIAAAAKRAAAAAAVTDDSDALQLTANSYVFEAEFPGGIGMLVRLACVEGCAMNHGTSQEMRSLFDRAGGKLGKALWMFNDVWAVQYDGKEKEGATDAIDLHNVAEIGINAGASDVDLDCEHRRVQFHASDRKCAAAVKQALAEVEAHSGCICVSLQTNPAGERKVPTLESGEKLRALITKLQERSDLIRVVHNATLPP